MIKTIWNQKLKSGKHYKCIEIYLCFCKVSIVSLGISKVDIRISNIKWGW